MIILNQTTIIRRHFKYRGSQKEMKKVSEKPLENFQCFYKKDYLTESKENTINATSKW